MQDFYGIDVPDRFREVAGRHQRHLAELVEKLRSAGMDSGLIERSVDQLIASFRSELLKAIKGMGSTVR